MMQYKAREDTVTWTLKFWSPESGVTMCSVKKRKLTPTCLQIDIAPNPQAVYFGAWACSPPHRYDKSTEDEGIRS